MTGEFTYASVCSGIEAATVAWHPLGWKPAVFSEIDLFPRAVLKHHYPDVPLHGDFTTIEANQYGSINLLAGGTPCQSFSIAGLRNGMDDERGNLSLEYLKLAKRKRPTWLVWENVPGVLSSNEGRDFGAFLAGLGECGYGFAYRVLDAQYFGVPQRRRRVFVVGYLGDWRPAAAVLFELYSLQGHSPPSRKTPQDITGTLDAGIGKRRGSGMNPNQITVNRMRGFGDYEEDETASALKQRDYKDATDLVVMPDQAEAFAFQPRVARNGRGAPSDIAYPLTAEAGKTGKGDSAQCVVSFAQNSRDEVRETEVAGALSSTTGMKQKSYIREGLRVRRFTPIECERLQGFPDNYTRIAWRGKKPEGCPDGPRYKALGNSMAVPVMHWLGQRINMVRSIIEGHIDD